MSSAVVEKTKPSTLKLPDPLANAQLRARKVALITGITGQDGSYLSEFLLERGYIIHGIIRRSSTFNTGRIEHLYTDKKLAGSFYLHYGDLSDTTNLVNIVAKIHPDEIYNLGAQSHVQVSFEMAEYTGDVDGLGTLRLLDAIRTCGLTKKTKFYQASTSELYGKVRETPQKETTPFYPRSPYAVAKQYAYWIVVNYREAYKMFAVNGILFNHESPRRGPTFVTRKTTRAVTRIARGLQDCLSLGNLDAQRDWGHARDYVEAMYLMLNNATEPTDYVVSSNQTHSVRKFVVKAFECVGINIRWEGTGVNEVGVDTKTGKILVRVDPKYFRPAEVDLLHGDSSKIQKELGWSLKVGFDDLVKEMIEADLRLLDETHDKSKQTVEVIAGKVEPPKIYGVVDVNKSVAGGVYSEHELEGRDANHDGVAFDNNFDYSKTPRILRNDGEQTFAGNMDLPGPSWAAIPDDDGPPRTTNKVALLTGITGQDGSYLAEFLLNKGYTVHGLIRRSSSFNTGRIEHLYVDPHTKSAKLFLHYGDLTDSTNLVHIIGKIRPDEIYNLAAQSHVQVSFEMAEYTGDVDGLGTLRLLDAIRTCGLTKKTKFYQASTSELYGWVRETPQKETTPFYPRSPYAVAKQYAYWIIVNYREAYGMFASNGILFNHESPRRGPTFVTRKTTRAVARIVKGLQECLYLGNLDAQRDWGHARDYVEGMWAMLQIDKPDDYVLSSGRTTSVRIFVEKAFKACGVDIQWKGSGVEEIGVDAKTGKVLVRVDPKYFRPTEVDLLLGDCSKARRDLQWDLKIDLDNLVKEMMEADLEGVQTTHLKW